MESPILFSVNIAMEATILLVLVMLLVTLFWQKKIFLTTIPLIYITCFIILNLINQIVTWVLLIVDAPSTYGAMPMRIVFVLDFIFFYGASVAFYYYAEALAVDGYERVGTKYTPNKRIKKVMIIWGIVQAIVYMALLFVPSIYKLENGIVSYSMPAYVFLNISTKFACFCSVVFLFRHKKVLGKHEAVISMCFLILISIFAVVDDLWELCIGHVLLSVFTFILYVSIDLHNALLLERQEREISEWKTEIMLSQMQPHFLYNVLTTISSMCEIENAVKARDVVNQFADYFRTNLESLGKDKTISFKKELEHVQTYLWLEKVRFEDALNISYEIGPTDFSVPSLTIQPMVENAVKHGIRPKEEGGTVTLRTCETDIDYLVIVEDDGVGFDVDCPVDDNREHVGIENVKRRLEIICRGTCEIQSSKGVGTVVTIHIPKGEAL